MHTFQRKPSLPVSQIGSRSDLSAQGGNPIRRRLSALSLKIPPPPTSWTDSIRRSKSLSSMKDYTGSSIRKWWDWGWSWILSRKPTFARDLELNEEESRFLGSSCKGSLRHVFYKVRSEIRKLVRSEKSGLPQTFRYDSSDYSKNFDNGESTYGR